MQALGGTYAADQPASVRPEGQPSRPQGVLVIFMFLFMIYLAIRHPVLFALLLSSGSRSGGGGFGGGGFSGGGGSFGGGGASGGW
jgi:uncharacterized membrane protein YgcG